MTEQVIRLENFVPVFDCVLIAKKSCGNVARVLELVEQAKGHLRGAGAALAEPLDFAANGRIGLGAVKFDSPLLTERLAGQARAFPYIVTEGSQMAEWGERYKNTPEAPVVHYIRQTAVMGCEQEIEKRLCEKFDIPVLSSLNPGSLKDWPISEQVRLFEVLGDIPERLGIRLLPSGIMQPDYSISGVFYQTDKKYYNCQLCPREGCPNRRAPRDI